jgi:hypothetical protein
MSSQNVAPKPPGTKKKVAYAFIDGFNFYHAIDYFPHSEDHGCYHKYKWLCYRTLMSRFLHPEVEELGKVLFFTSFPNWPYSEAKRVRHETYVSALKICGVETVKGEFKTKQIECKATCKRIFEGREEKQTDVNIATSMIERANEYDIAMLVTADSDQVPTIRLLKKLHPEKTIYIVPPIGRNSKELVKAARKGSRKIMEEADLAASLLPNPVLVVRDGKTISQIWKPKTWPTPEGNQDATHKHK